MAYILYAYVTEKTSGMIEAQNKLAFIVAAGATKKQVAEEIQKRFNEKVKAVRVINAFSGKRKAIVKFERKNAAADVASKLKLV